MTDSCLATCIQHTSDDATGRMSGCFDGVSRSRPLCFDAVAMEFGSYPDEDAIDPTQRKVCQFRDCHKKFKLYQYLLTHIHNVHKISRDDLVLHWVRIASLRERSQKPVQAATQGEASFVGLAYNADGTVAEEDYTCLPCGMVLRKRTAFNHTVSIHGMQKCDVKNWLVVKDGWTFKNGSSSEYMYRHLKLTAGLRLHWRQVVEDASGPGGEGDHGLSDAAACSEGEGGPGVEADAVSDDSTDTPIDVLPPLKGRRIEYLKEEGRFAKIDPEPNLVSHHPQPVLKQTRLNDCWMHIDDETEAVVSHGHSTSSGGSS